MKTQAFLEHMLWLRVVVLLIQRLRLIRLLVGYCLFQMPETETVFWNFTAGTRTQEQLRVRGFYTSERFVKLGSVYLWLHSRRSGPS